MKNGPNMLTQSEAPEPEKIELHKQRRDQSSLSATRGGRFLTGRIRASVTP